MRIIDQAVRWYEPHISYMVQGRCNAGLGEEACSKLRYVW